MLDSSNRYAPAEARGMGLERLNNPLDHAHLAGLSHGIETAAGLGLAFGGAVLVFNQLRKLVSGGENRHE